MGYREMSLRSFIKEVKDVTYGTHPRRFCFILGAGASRNSGIPSGVELVKLWDSELRERNEVDYNNWRTEEKINNDNMANYYSQYYDKRFERCKADGYNFIEKIMDSAKPSAGYVMLAHLLTETPHKVVITTNFDHLTEDAITYYTKGTPLVIGHENLAHYVSTPLERPTIIKIHRDLLYSPKSNTEDIVKLHDSWRDALELIFKNYYPVFIGYAGNDPSLMDFLVENANKFADDTWRFPYWLLYEGDELKGKVKKFLELSNGYCICHNGFDYVMVQLGAAFDYKTPSEDDFLQDAKNRYKDLAEAIDALSSIKKEDSKVKLIDDNSAPSSEAVTKSKDPTENDIDVEQAIDKITSQSERPKMYREAMNLYYANKENEAADILKKLVDLEPENARYHIDLGHALRFSNQKDEAMAAYRRAIELEPKNHHHYHAIAMAQKHWGNYEEALTEYKNALNLSPLPTYYNNLAKMQIVTNKYEDALESIKTAISLAPNNSDYYDTMSKTLRGLGRNDEADTAAKKVNELRKAIKQN